MMVAVNGTQVNPTKTKRILIIGYSFSGQTSGLVRQILTALQQEGHEVVKERLTPEPALKFPTSSIWTCLAMMLTTFLRIRTPIQALSPVCFTGFDLIILAGPTWSYNPSGPILSLIDRDGERLFAGQTVLPVISCRGYWRMHRWGLVRLLVRTGARVPNCIVFSHPNREPWRTIGVFLKIAGKTPERWPILRRHYTHFGHSRDQQDEAARFGTLIGQALSRGESLAEIEFHTPLALP